MDKEIQALEQTHTWVLTPLPPGIRPIGCKWVYKVKLNPNGIVERYKTRLPKGIPKGRVLISWRPSLLLPKLYQ